MELQLIQEKIYHIRGQKVMLDFDLAALYEVETKVLKQAVKRNLDRFPKDFMFELSKEEFERLRSQFVTSKRGGMRYQPFAFTEQGVSMLASVLRSHIAIQVSIAIIRAFVLMRQHLTDYKELKESISAIENEMSTSKMLAFIVKDKTDDRIIKEFSLHKKRKENGNPPHIQAHLAAPIHGRPLRSQKSLHYINTPKLDSNNL